ncbi:MAG: glucosyl-3-phosphoglycerate synthase [Desulfobulbus sp.]|nr:glucosyl-3-phosphoglycerate synthase [Desulfobulbus sp.]
MSTHTFHHRQFADAAALVRQKQAQGVRLSLVIPTLNEAQTIGAVLAQLLPLRDTLPLLDEIAVFDSGSVDKTAQCAHAAGADVYQAADILPEMGQARGKGENLWKALYRLSGDILVVLDADISNMHPRFVTGLVGPLLHQSEIGYVKACYDRPAGLGSGRVTEILARPLLSLHFPELSGFIQPLAGEFAARRSLLETIPFPVGYGVEIAHLIDLHARHGLGIFAQTDLGQRCHRNRGNDELGRMACAILLVLERRLRQQGQASAPAVDGCLIRQFVRDHGAFKKRLVAIEEQERPPMLTVSAYRQGCPHRLDRQPSPWFLAAHSVGSGVVSLEE